MKDYFYHVLRNTCNDLRTELSRHPEKENKLRDRLIKAWNLIFDFFGMREYKNASLAIEVIEKSAGDLKNYFDKAFYFHYLADDIDEEYSLLASHIEKQGMSPENALALIFISNGIFFCFSCDGNRYRIYQNEIFNVLPYEFSDLKLVTLKNSNIMKYDIKRPLYDYSKPSFYPAPAKRDMTPDENDSVIMKRLEDFDKKVISVSDEQCKDKSKYSLPKHYYLADKFLQILIDSLSDEELSYAFSDRKNQDIIEIIRSLDKDRKMRVIDSLPEIKKKILLAKMEGIEEFVEEDYFAKELFFKDAGMSIRGHYLNQSACFAEYGSMFDKLDKSTETKVLIKLMENANQKYARAAAWQKSDMLNRRNAPF